MAGVTSVQAIDICRLCHNGCRQGLAQDRNSSFALRWHSSVPRRALLQSGPRSELSARVDTTLSASHKQQKVSRAASSEAAGCSSSKLESRRAALLLGGTAFITSLSNLVVSKAEAQAAAEKIPIVEEVPEFVKALVEKSKQNKAKYDKQRLDDYNRRNFSDYFAFTTGQKNPSKMTETEKQMVKWLEANKKK